ncbi:M15 family metallopeptidase [Paenibacillus sp. y28]|uniref:M15 family metallopeptidase n=1 Tax=Paenibacillus sp. y28 TaxID=3129110 RepID=UPI0030183496
MRYDARNEQRIALLHPTVAALARQLLQLVEAEGMDVLITQTLRTVEEQDALYAQGRTAAGAIVTNAKGGYSYHNYGLALDYCLVNADGSASWVVNSDWRRVAELAKGFGFAWGGDWTSFVDYPHLEYTFGLSIDDLLAGQQPPEPGEEETDRVLSFEADWQWKQLGDALDGLYHRGLISDYTWAEKAYNRKLTVSALDWLNIIVQARQAGVGV